MLHAIQVTVNTGMKDILCTKQSQLEQDMMLSLFNAMPLLALFGSQVNAISLRIYTPVKFNYGLLTLREDWTIDSTTRDEFIAMDVDYAQRLMPKPQGDENLFALTGLLTWKGDKFDKRAFWIVPLEGDKYRGLTKVRLLSKQGWHGLIVASALSNQHSR